jgi:pyruvate/2-oxoglutarate dehydrogenase complex dihydrolipoamide dehydrogenase (E3) component
MGSEIVVIGGGQVGAETADFLAELNKKVTLIELTEVLCADGQSAVNSFLFDYWEAKNGGARPRVTILTNTKITEISDDSVTYVKGARTGAINGVTDDAVAVGYESYNNLGSSIAGVDKVVIVGDALKVDDAMAAAAGFRAGYYI